MSEPIESIAPPARPSCDPQTSGAAVTQAACADSAAAAQLRGLVEWYAAQYEKLTTAHEELSTAHKELRRAHAALRPAHDSLLAAHLQLSTTYTGLSLAHEDLILAHDELILAHESHHRQHLELSRQAAFFEVRVRS